MESWFNTKSCIHKVDRVKRGLLFKFRDPGYSIVYCSGIHNDIGSNCQHRTWTKTKSKRMVDVTLESKTLEKARRLKRQDT